MLYWYYVSFVYLNKKGESQFGDTVYSHVGGIKNEKDIRILDSMLRLQYGVKNLRVLAFCPLTYVTLKETVKEIIDSYILERCNSKRWRKKLKALRMVKRRGDS